MAAGLDVDPSEISKPEVDPDLGKIPFRNIEVGMYLDGFVTRIEDYGCFIDVGSERPGLVPIADLSDTYVANVRDFVKIGEKVVVKVVRRDVNKRQLAFTMKTGLTRQDVLNRITAMSPEDTTTGVVSSIRDFGVFLDLGAGVQGLLHKNQMGLPEGATPDSTYNLGDSVKDVRVININSETNRVALTKLPYDPKNQMEMEERLKMAEERKKREAEMQTVYNKVYEELADANPKETRKGKITTVTSLGVWVGVHDDVQGLVHRSNIPDVRPRTNLTAMFKVGDEVTYRVIGAERLTNRLRVELSMLPYDPSEEIDVEALVAEAETKIQGQDTGLAESLKTTGRVSAKIVAYDEDFLYMELSDSGLIGVMPIEELNVDTLPSDAGLNTTLQVRLKSIVTDREEPEVKYLYLTQEQGGFFDEAQLTDTGKEDRRKRPQPPADEEEEAPEAEGEGEEDEVMAAKRRRLMAIRNRRQRMERFKAGQEDDRRAGGRRAGGEMRQSREERQWEADNAAALEEYDLVTMLGKEGYKQLQKKRRAAIDIENIRLEYENLDFNGSYVLGLFDNVPDTDDAAVIEKALRENQKRLEMNVRHLKRVDPEALKKRAAVAVGDLVRAQNQQYDPRALQFLDEVMEEEFDEVELAQFRKEYEEFVENEAKEIQERLQDPELPAGERLKLEAALDDIEGYIVEAGKDDPWEVIRNIQTQTEGEQDIIQDIIRDELNRETLLMPSQIPTMDEVMGWGEEGAKQRARSRGGFRQQREAEAMSRKAKESAGILMPPAPEDYSDETSTSAEGAVDPEELAMAQVEKYDSMLRTLLSSKVKQQEDDTVDLIDVALDPQLKRDAIELRGEWQGHTVKIPILKD